MKRKNRLHALVTTKRFAALILIILSVTLYIPSFLRGAYAATPSLTVSPNMGHVGDTVKVNGSIQTGSGKYAIYFDNAFVKDGNATAQGNFTNTFIVPYAVNGTHAVKLQDISTNTNITAGFTVVTEYYIKAIYTPPEPNEQMQEGNNVTISAQIVGGNSTHTYTPLNITVTTPVKTHYNASLSLTTNSTGTVNGTLTYPTDFSPTNASNTNFTGTYVIQLFYRNATTAKAQSSFFIGLTNATLYQRLDTVNVKAAGYTKQAENANVTIKFGNETIASYSQKTNGTNGIVTYNWPIPVNASQGSYKVTVAASNASFPKKVESQNFTVPGLKLRINATTLNGTHLPKVDTAVYEIVKGNETLVPSSSNSTGSNGQSTTILTHGGNYMLKAFWKGAFNPVNTTNIYVEGNSTWVLTCQIADLEFTVENSSSGALPLVLLNVTVTYQTSANESETVIEDNLTNTAGEGMFRNQLVMANYTIRAYRAPYQSELLFNTTKLGNDTISQFINRNITIICPLRNLTVHAEDARHALLAGYPVQIYEFDGGPYEYNTTDAFGNVTFVATFGEYQIRLYDPNEILLNQTYYNLTNAKAFFVLGSDISHANLSVTVLDYLGLPVSNIYVELERGGAASITMKTNGRGVALFNSITGGSCFISISTGSGAPIETSSVLVEGNAATTVKLESYVSVFGLLVSTGQFAVVLTFVVIVILLLFFLLYRRRNKAHEGKTEKES